MSGQTVLRLDPFFLFIFSSLVRSRNTINILCEKNESMHSMQFVAVGIVLCSAPPISVGLMLLGVSSPEHLQVPCTSTSWEQGCSWAEGRAGISGSSNQHRIPTPMVDACEHRDTPGSRLIRATTIYVTNANSRPINYTIWFNYLLRTNLSVHLVPPVSRYTPGPAQGSPSTAQRGSGEAAQGFGTGRRDFNPHHGPRAVLWP